MKTLIVDDSPFIMLICRQTLEKAGFQVVGEAYDGMEAIEKAQSLMPDFIIMDIALPKKNGFEAAQYILDMNPNTQILAISAIEEDWVRKKAEEAGCFNFLAKPFETSELMSLLKSLKDNKKELKYG